LHIWASSPPLLWAWFWSRPGSAASGPHSRPAMRGSESP